MNFFKRLFSDQNKQKSEPATSHLPKSGYDQAMIAKATQRIAVYSRSCFVPKTVDSTEPSFGAHSKFGGYPYLRNEADWPTCPNCQAHMALFLQLNCNEIKMIADDAVLQVFYCSNYDAECDSELGGWEAFSKVAVLRRIYTEGESASITPNLPNRLQERIIMGWEEQPDYPHHDDYEDFGIELGLTQKELDDFQEYSYEEVDDYVPLGGDKLFGWPHWIQYPEYPKDRTTGKQMNMIFQLDSEVHLDYMFGDVGIAHIYQSPDNKDELAMTWACT